MSKKYIILLIICLWIFANLSFLLYLKPQAEAKEKKREEEKQAIQVELQAKKQAIQVELQAKIKWVDIPAGTFTMGSPTNEKDRDANESQHQVTLSAYKMSKYEVTFEQYDFFCEATGREKPEDRWGRDERPVTTVSWDDAVAFAEWLGCRLPTESEWEYAALADSKIGKTKWSGTNNKSNLVDYAWINVNSEIKTHPVGTKRPNAMGLYDMNGNVKEWCSDWYAEYPTMAQTDPTGPLSGTHKVLRGGDWFDDPKACRIAKRDLDLPYNKSHVVGFRIAKSSK